MVVTGAPAAIPASAAEPDLSNLHVSLPVDNGVGWLFTLLGALLESALPLADVGWKPNH